MKKFAIKYELGDPYAGNFFLCEYDGRTNETLNAMDYMPEYVERAISRAAYERASKRKPYFQSG